MSIVANRYEFVYLFDCEDGNPSGEPDTDYNLRVDPQTFQGLISDVWLKRKVRDYVYQRQQRNGTFKKGFDVFALSPYTLEDGQGKPLDKWEGEATAQGKDTKFSDIRKARDWMCENFFDVRTFGAVMSTTEFNCGQVRGPVQLTASRSVDRVKASAMGRFGEKSAVGYGLYAAHGFIDPVFARQTGFSEEDLGLFWEGLENMFSVSPGAAQGQMSARELFVFKHDLTVGEDPGRRLFDLVQPKLKEGVACPRRYTDYEPVAVEESRLPRGIRLLTPFAVLVGA